METVDYKTLERIYLKDPIKYLTVPLNSPFKRLIKKTFDITLSIMMLPIILIFIGIIAFIVKIVFGGPIFYIHPRVGQNGKMFKIYKFRTMCINSEEILKEILQTDAKAKEHWERYFKLKNDPRITKAGKLLRKTSLDELPQILNVLKGNMSLVGPRPVMAEEITKYYKDDAKYYVMAKPGMTGFWQINGRNNIAYASRINFDIWYILNWSLWLDITILIKTIKIILKRVGAY